MFETIFKKLTPDCEPWVLEHTIQLALELAPGRTGGTQNRYVRCR